MFRMQIHTILLAFVVCLWPWSVLRHYKDKNSLKETKKYKKYKLGLSWAILSYQLGLGCSLIKYQPTG